VGKDARELGAGGRDQGHGSLPATRAKKWSNSVAPPPAMTMSGATRQAEAKTDSSSAGVWPGSERCGRERPRRLGARPAGAERIDTGAQVEDRVPVPAALARDREEVSTMRIRQTGSSREAPAACHGRRPQRRPGEVRRPPPNRQQPPESPTVLRAEAALAQSCGAGAALQPNGQRIERGFLRIGRRQTPAKAIEAARKSCSAPTATVSPGKIGLPVQRMEQPCSR